MTIMEGVKLTIEERWQDVLIESDKKMVVKQLNDIGFLWMIDTIVQNIKVIAISIDRVSWVSVPRSVNQCANWLAKDVYFYSGSRDHPCCIFTYLGFQFLKLFYD